MMQGWGAMQGDCRGESNEIMIKIVNYDVFRRTFSWLCIALAGNNQADQRS